MVEKPGGPEVRLEAFEGPMELLLHLIGKNRINIYDIPIAEITAQYLGHLRCLERMEMEPLSEFLVMAATLIEIKSRMLLPSKPGKIEEEDDPRMELVNRLVEYKLYKRASELFAGKALNGEMYVFRPADSGFLERARQAGKESSGFEEGACAAQLFQAFSEVLRRREVAVMPVAESVNILPDSFTVGEQARRILGLLAERGSLVFAEIFDAGAGKMEIIVTFVALLELVKQRELAVRQDKTFADIVLYAYDK